MTGERSAVLAGFFFGITVAVWICASPWSDASYYKAAIRECEKKLPRDQHCKVIGVPELK